ncbi:MAG: virulence RhuM family protein [Porphyromonadaceae bacterium]|nr:virulence RhuM family protein [Porphyromonadaceae bacterium]
MPVNANSEIILYQSDNSIQLEVRMEEETVWLNRQQLAMLFNRDVKTIGKHINNAIKEELQDLPTVANFATVQLEGSRIVERQIEYYNLDVILSVGYRVKSKEGVKFRIWANRILKDYLLKGYAVNNRIENLEHRVKATEDKIEFFVKTALPPVQGIFFDGQIFDAHKFVSDVVKSAKKSIILIDNYVDESVLHLLSKRKSSVSCKIFTNKITNQFQLDLQKFNAQYEPIEVAQFSKSHDRFLIIDNQEVYHIGASLKDLGKKWFAFSKIKINAEQILAALST